MTIKVDIPQKYIGKIEIAINAKRLELIGMDNESIEFDGKVTEIYLENGKGDVEINCNLDMSIDVASHEGSIEINQISATSRIRIPDDYFFRVGKKGIGTAIYYEKHGKRVEDFSSDEADNYIELNGIKSELLIIMEEV